MPKISSINEFVVKFANVNGSGSASANGMFARAIFRMGVSVSPRNIFPSNIQGLPTWYEVRISEKGYLGARGGVDLMVAMNPQSIADDIIEIESGGYLLYDSTSMLSRQLVREDINYIAIPLTSICNSQYADARERQLFKNIIYLGALSELLGIDEEVLAILVTQQYGSKTALIESNFKALDLGRDFIKENFNAEFGLKLKRSDAIKDRILMEGNSAIALGAVYAGAMVGAWYPITPSTSVFDAFTKYCEKYRVDSATGQNNYAIIQAEDELAAIGMVIGASWNGARAFTATSGPGVSLMNEFIGLAYFAEIPAVIVDVQRGGPSTGMPSRTQQSDLLMVAHASHGDTQNIMLFPSNPKECFDFSVQAFDLAERLQTPIFLMSDLDIGMNDGMSDPLEWDESFMMDRGKVKTAEGLDSDEAFGRYLDVDGDGIPYRTYPGTHPEKGSFFTRGTTRDEYARYTEHGPTYVANMERLVKKFETAKQMLPAPVITDEGNDVGVIFFGSTDAAMQETIDTLREKGVLLDTLRLRAYPFQDQVLAFVEKHQRVFVVEQNRDGQLRKLLIADAEMMPKKMVSITHYDGSPITARFISGAILRYLNEQKVTPIREMVT